MYLLCILDDYFVVCFCIRMLSLDCVILTLHLGQFPLEKETVSQCVFTG